MKLNFYLCNYNLSVWHMAVILTTFKNELKQYDTQTIQKAITD